KKIRDENPGWSIDANVSLVDVGATLFALVSDKDYSIQKKDFDIVSLTPVFEKPKVHWRKDRSILTESAWAQWRGVGGIRYSVRRDSWFHLFGSPNLHFNTLIDRKEVNPSTRSLEAHASDLVGI